MRGRRGTVLLLVLLVVVMATLAGTSALYVADAQIASSESSRRRAQGRALAWSGVQAVMAELAEQREALLAGEEPRLTEEWELFASLEGAGERGVVRLLPVQRSRDGGPDLVLASESAKIDVNVATAEMLEALGIEAELASRIVEARSSRRFESVLDLLRVEGMTAERLVGVRGEEAGAEDDVPLIELLTTLSFDPNVQAGLGDDGERHRGNLRINLNVPWSEPFGRALDDRFGVGVGEAVKSLFAQGTTFKKDSDVAKFMTRASVPAEDWARVFDAVTTTDDPYRPGRVDLNTAPERVLASVPGIGAETARRIVDAREGLSAESRLSVAWPLVEGLMTAEAWTEAVDWLTTRSMQWRVLVEAGVEVGEEVEWSPGATLRGTAADRPPLRGRVVLEAVIDVASERPRVAYLRDVTMLEVARGLARPAAEGDVPARGGSPTGVDEAGSSGSMVRGDGSGAGGASGAGDDDRARADEEHEGRGDGARSSGSSSAGAVPELGPDRRTGRWRATGGSGGGG